MILIVEVENVSSTAPDLMSPIALTMSNDYSLSMISRFKAEVATSRAIRVSLGATDMWWWKYVKCTCPG